MATTSGADQTSFVNPLLDDATAEDSKARLLKEMTKTIRSEVKALFHNYTCALGAAFNKDETATSSFVKNIHTIFKKDETMDVPICIFKVPKSLASSKPEAYVPQLMGLGPYHHLRPELQQMQTYKLSEVKRVGKGFKENEFELLVGVLEKIIGPSARACYDTYLDVDDEDLACMLAIDGMFLFGLLCYYGIGSDALAQSELLKDLVSFSGRRLARDTTLGDAMMVENQVPLLVLKVILITLEMIGLDEKKMKPLSLFVSNPFPQMLLVFCKALSPLKVLTDYPWHKVLNHSHLLDLMYHLIILKNSPKRYPDEELEEERFIEKLSKKVKKEISKVEELNLAQEAPPRPSETFEHVLQIVPEELQKPVELVKGLRELPWSTLWSAICEVAKAPVVQEILIPRASELRKAGLIFEVADHITDIKFELTTLSFYLPLIEVDVNSEVIIRNLVAYEVMTKSESDSLILTRYMELMKGLVESAEDVKVLEKVIESKSIKEEEVAKLFNGMNKSIRSTNTSDLDKTIAEVNRYYDGLWTVSVTRFYKKWQWTAWNLCRVIATLLVLVLLAIQAFCSVYQCPRFSVKSNNSLAL